MIKRIILSIVVLSLIIFTIIWNINNNKKHPVETDKVSSDRLTDINNLLTSLLGIYWPYVLFMIAIILIILFYTLYLLSLQGININISDDHTKPFTIILSIFLILFFVSIVILTIRSIQTQNLDSTYCTNNYKPMNEQISDNNQTLQIIGLSLFIIISIGLGIYYFFIRKRFNNNT